MSASPPSPNAADDARHRGVIGRIRGWQWWCAAIGFPVWFLAGGPREAVSFAIGAAASIASFSLLDQFSAVLTGGRPARTNIALSVFRLLLIGGALFVIIKLYSIHTLAAATGLLITVVAIMIEALFGSLLCMNLG